MIRYDDYARGSVQRKHPTRATKLELLEFIARCREADVATVARHFRLSETGARCKMWRLTKQCLLEINPESYKPKTWQLTRAGRRHLRYLKEAEDYGGTKGLLVSNLTAEVAELRADVSHWKKVVEDGPSVFQQVVNMAHENTALRGDLAAVTREMQRLGHENEALRAAIARRYRR
jgi:hypothetical protein